MTPRTVLALTAALLLSGPATAAEKKPAGLREFPFWAAPKQPHARGFVPGLQAALQLTPEQAEKIEAACRETIDQPEARMKGGAGGAAAVEKLHKLVADILTADQKKLIEKVNDAYAKVSATVGEEFQPRYAAAKGNAEEAEKVRADHRAAVTEAFEKVLGGVLTNEQRDAVKAAGDEQKKRDAENKGKPKPGK